MISKDEGVRDAGYILFFSYASASDCTLTYTPPCVAFPKNVNFPFLGQSAIRL